MLQQVVNCFLKVMRDTCKWNFFPTLIIWPLPAVGCRQEVCGNIDGTVIGGFGGGVSKGNGVGIGQEQAQELAQELVRQLVGNWQSNLWHFVNIKIAFFNRVAKKCKYSFCILLRNAKPIFIFFIFQHVCFMTQTASLLKKTALLNKHAKK